MSALSSGRSFSSILSLLFLLSLSSCSLFIPTLSLRLSGELFSPSPFVYLGKFAYVASGGNLSVTTVPLLSPTSNSTSYLFMFADTDLTWDSLIASPSLTCSQLLSLGDVVQVGIDFNVPVVGRRPHFWYFALSNCNTSLENDLPLDFSGGSAQAQSSYIMAASYNFHFTNGGNVFHNEVSFNQQSIAEMAIFFFLVYFCLFMPLLIHAIYRSKGQVERPIFFLLFSAVAFEILSQLLTLSYEARGFTSGTYTENINRAAWWMDTFAQLILLSFVFLFAAGFPLSTTSLRETPKRAFLAVWMLLYCIFYIASFAVYEQWQDNHPSSNAFVFDFWPGYVLCLMRALSVPIVYYLLQSAMQQQPAQHRLLMRFAIFSSLWLVAFPICTVISVILEPWWRARGAYGLFSVVTFFAISLPYLLFHPYQAQKSSFKQMKDTRDEEQNGREPSSDISQPHDTIEFEGGSPRQIELSTNSRTSSSQISSV